MCVPWFIQENISTFLFHRSCYTWVVAHWLLTVLTWVQSQVNSCGICSERNCTRAGFPPGTVFFCDRNSLSSSRFHFEKHMQLFQASGLTSKSLLNSSITLCLHCISTRPFPFWCFLWLSSVPPGKCQESIFIRPWPVPNPLQLMNHSVLSHVI